MKMSRTGFIYLITFRNPIHCGSCNQDTRQTFCKIGYTTNDPRMRTQMIETDCPLEITELKVVIWDKALEQFLHGHFSHCNIRGEWFVLGPEELNEARYYMDNPPDYQFQKGTKKYRPRNPFSRDTSLDL